MVQTQDKGKYGTVPTTEGGAAAPGTGAVPLAGAEELGQNDLIVEADVADPNRAAIGKRRLLVGVLLACCVLFVGTMLASKSFHGAYSTMLGESDNSEHQKHVLLILADDLGHIDVSEKEHKYQAAFTNLDKYMYDGVRMTNHYSMHLCTPARGALLTGKYPVRLGLQHDLIELNSPWGLPTTHTLMSQKMQEAGYRTHLVGKWHLGHHNEEFMPQNRGFDSFYGFLTGMVWYYWHKHPLMLNNHYWHDFMHGLSDGSWKVVNQNVGTYNTILMLDRAKEVISGHDTSKPLFLMMSMQNTHAPLDDPPSDIFTDAQRDLLLELNNSSFERNYVKSMIWLDHSVQYLVDNLEERGMMDDTLMVFISDNGGCYLGGGFNSPLRGGKGTLYEGGTKTNAFVYSRNLPESVRGTTYDNLMHISDWFPTLATYAGYDLDKDDPIDGVDHWNNLVGMDTDAPRSEMLYNVDTYYASDSKSRSRAIRVGDHKLIYERLSPYYEPQEDDSFDPMNSDYEAMDCRPDGLVSHPFRKQVYNLKEDPFETDDIKDTIDPNFLTYLEMRLQSYSASAADECFTSGEETGAMFKMWEEHSHSIVPWSDESTQACDVPGTPDIADTDDHRRTATQ